MSPGGKFQNVPHLVTDISVNTSAMCNADPSTFQNLPPGDTAHLHLKYFSSPNIKEKVQMYHISNGQWWLENPVSLVDGLLVQNIKDSWNNNHNSS